MNITLPLYVEGIKQRGGAILYQARPLFFPTPLVRGEKLERLLTRLMLDLGQVLTELGRRERHDELARYTFSPRLAQERLEVTIPLRRRTARCRFLFVSFRQFGRRIAFTPGVPEVWFDLARGERLADRAAEVLTKHYRDLEQEDEEARPEQAALSGTAQVMPLELTIHPPRKPPAPPKQSFLMLGSEQPASGAAELRRVGRCLDWQFPDDLDRAVLREAEVTELTRLLIEPDNRPVLLLGPRQAGKTAVLHEYVRREVSQRPSIYRDRRNVWLLAPARLIAGMCYVGQWEDRLLAILREARKRHHLLYFDDLLGLFLAGQSSQSTLSVADVLQPYLERRQVRVVAEITPEAFRVLREKNRGFADLFHVLPVAEPGEAETLRILIAVQRELEGKHRCAFALDVLPTVIDLQRRFRRDLAFPGKAAALLRQLAFKYANTERNLARPAEEPPAITRALALEEFHAQTGLAVAFLDNRARLERQEILDALGEPVVGQERAVEAAADVIGIAKARLNDPDRPLAAFLFLGPTGVGKTQCAKALAAYLFGDAQRLLRFDLNEYGTFGAAARLVGTFIQPEGLLTAAIRRQPFAVVLFDEVEKAHPEVFDLLLQVLGEGRLTDALGRTADFGNALIVLTSNLGVRESEGQLGFHTDEAARDAGFIRAAERFFRPEFINRLDRILPFGRLSRGQVAAITQRLIQEVFGREGLAQRQCVLAVEPAALERVVEKGYDPVLGARALKRAVENELTHPVAAQLAGMPVGRMTAVRVCPGPGQLVVAVQALEEAEPVRPPVVGREVPGLVGRVRTALRRIEDGLGRLRPAGAVTLGAVRAEQYHYFALREQVETVRDQCRRLEEQSEEERLASLGPPAYSLPDRPRGARRILRRIFGIIGTGGILRELATSLDVNEYLRELAGAAETPGEREQEVQELLRQCALLQAIAEGIGASVPRALLWLRSLQSTPNDAERFLCDGLLGSGPALHVAVRPVAPEPPHAAAISGTYLLAEGVHALAVFQAQAGLYLFCPAHAPLNLMQVGVRAVADGEDAEAVARAWARQRQDWLAAVADGRATPGDDPLPTGPVLRIYDAAEGVFDLRSGLHGKAEDLANLILAGLPLPPELVE
jgi:ATP-dependent Clp protease ATP-binding subunit ClpA